MSQQMERKEKVRSIEEAPRFITPEELVEKFRRLGIGAEYKPDILNGRMKEIILRIPLDKKLDVQVYEHHSEDKKHFYWKWFGFTIKYGNENGEFVIDHTVFPEFSTPDMNTDTTVFFYFNGKREAYTIKNASVWFAESFGTLDVYIQPLFPDEELEIISH